MRHHVSRFFRRARNFLHELITAGAMALSGPGGLDADDLAEVDRQTAVQVAFLDRFEQEVRLSPPAEIAEPSGLALANPMTAAEFAARAEKYGQSVWISAINHDRNKTVRSGRFNQERRRHRKPLDAHHACSTCRGESAKRWVPIGSLSPIGDSECGGYNCDCYFTYRMAV